MVDTRAKILTDYIWAS